MKTLNFLITLICLAFVSEAQNSWSPLNSNVTESLLKVQCLTADTIFLFGENGVLLKSTDGGNNFMKKQYAQAAIYTSGHFFHPDSGFTADGNGFLRRTYDGGNNRSIVNGCTCFINDVCMSSSQIGLMSNLSGVYRTDDGGSNWVATNVTFSSRKIVAVEDSIFLAIDDTMVYRITDAGLSHTVQTVNTLSNASLSGISFIDSQNGYAVSTDGHLFRTTDQGLNWSELISNTIIDISGLDFVDSLHGFMIVGPQRNYIYKSIDGGHNWMLDYTASDPMESISHHGDAVYVCGQNGLILKKRVSLVNVPETEKQSFNFTINLPNNSVSISSKDRLAGKKYEIHNSNGQLLIYGKFQTGQSDIDIYKLNSGIYFLRISDFDAVRLNLLRTE